MADITTKINGQAVTLTDNGDGTYRIDLSTAAARRFIRDGELQQLRAARDEAIVARDAALQGITTAVARRDTFLADRDRLNQEITELNENIAALAAWLQSQGDSA